MRILILLLLALLLASPLPAAAQAEGMTLSGLKPALSTRDMGDGAVKPVDPAAFDRLHKTFLLIKKTEPQIGEPPKERGAIDRLFAGARKLFGSQTEEDLFYDAYEAYGKGDYAKAADLFGRLAQRKPGTLRYRYFHSLALMGDGRIMDADQALKGVSEELREKNFLRHLNAVTDPYVNERVAFKIGGFDSIDQYREKVLAGNRTRLHGDEYYEKYVDPRTWKWRSEAARKEFEKIGGIDCGGFVQRVHMGLCEKAGLKPPFRSKLPGDHLKKPEYSKRLKEDGGIPPKTAKPGDIMFLSKKDGWGHVFVFDGWNEKGQPMIVEASGEGHCMRRPMPDRYIARYDGTYRWNQMDEIRKRLADKV